MGKAVKSTMMDISTMGNSRIMLGRVKAHTHIRTGPNTKATGSTTNATARAWQHGSTGAASKGSGELIDATDRDQ